MKKDISKTNERAVPFGHRSHVLDGIRGIAILSVLCFHTLRVYGDGNIALKAWRCVQESAWVGVDLFFVLSGFLITGILLDSKGCRDYFKNFYARRALRIMPLYYGTLLVVLVLVPLVVGYARLPELYHELLKKQAWLWLYVQNYLQARGEHQLPGFGHFWSLAIEEQFYWVWPVVVFFFNRKTLIRICIAICLIEPILRAVLLGYGASDWALREYTFTRADTLLWGGLAALLIRDPQLFERCKSFLKWLAIVPVSILIVLTAMRGFLPYEADGTVVLGYSALGMLFSGFLLYCTSQDSMIARLCSKRVFRWFGKYSYGIYIFHPFALQAFTALGSRLHLNGFAYALACFVTVTTISSTIAVFTWWCMESRVLRLKKYFEYQPKEKPLLVNA